MSAEPGQAAGDDPLDRTLQLIRSAPHSAPALTLYALISTLEFEQAGCLFKLTKLRDVDEEVRKLAYQLMELMVRGKNQGERWQAVKQAMDEAVRHG